MKSLIKDNKGGIVLPIFISFLLIVAIILIQMSLAPVLMEIVAATNQFQADNPSENAGSWRVNLNSSLRFYAASTGILCLSLIVWCVISGIKREYKTYYR